MLAAIRDAFDDEGISPRERKLANAERQCKTIVNKGHGRLEKRTPISTTSLNDGYVDWPGPGQCFKLVRERTIHSKKTRETVLGITSLEREQADARRLLKLVRSHWGIENSVFHVRDVSFAEDGCRVRSGSGPFIFSSLRNAAINLLNWSGAKNMAAALRRHAHAAHPEEALPCFEDPDEN